jgi:exodeoxyribonuclease V alpha subunit
VASFAGAAEAFDVVELLLPAGVEPRLAGRAAAELSPGAAQALRNDPWRLLDAEGALLADGDRLATSLGVSGSAALLLRGRAIVLDVLRRAAVREGSTAQPLDVVVARVADAGADAAEAVAAAVDSGRVLLDAGQLVLERYAVAEDAVATGLARLVATARPLDCDEDLTAGLDDAQRSAVAAALAHGVSLLTGGPGTGKSRTVDAVVRAARARGRRVALAAPTGRAAKRLEELTDAEASTVHRLLGAQGMTGEFARGEAWPLDADLVVVDEVSMLDAELAAALVDACADGTHLLLVGDPAQLASVGAGRVLGDLLDTGRLATTELRTLYRQAEGGAIARLAAAVRDGVLPVPAPPEETGYEVVVVPAAHAEEAAHRAVQLVTRSVPSRLGIPAGEVQVVTPVHRGAAGTQALNAALKAALNPGPGAHGGFDVGDRVVATANRLDVGFANGEVGLVTGVVQKGGLEVTFASGPCEVPSAAYADLGHGWALTVHRAQGSEWPAVVAVVPPEAAGMLSRPLVYTAFTRARAHLSVVNAAGPALGRAVRQIGARPRVTRLRELLTEELEGLG